MSYLLLNIDGAEVDLSEHVKRIDWGISHPRGNPGVRLHLISSNEALTGCLPLLRARGSVRLTYGPQGHTPGLPWKSGEFIVTDSDISPPLPSLLLLQSGPEETGTF